MNKGFTLIEVVVSMGIAVILLTLAVTAYKSIQPSILLSEAARVLSTDIRYAQQKALSTQKKHAVIFSPPTTYQIVVTEPSTSTIKTVTLKDDITISSITGLSGNLVLFNPVGEPNQNGTVELSKDTKKINVDIRPSGYVRVQKQ